MQRTGVIIATLVMLFALALPAFGAGPAWPPPPPVPHGHLLVLSNGTCVELAANQVIPRNAHHMHLHVGTAGDAQRAAGNTVYAALQWANCAELLADLNS